MKKKIIDIIVDVLLIAMIFAVTDIVLLKVLKSEDIWLELGIYTLFYAIVFGCKKGILILWSRFVSRKKDNH